MYESRDEGVISRRRFALRLLTHLALALIFIMASLSLGLVGYMWLEGGVHWHDVALNIAMIAAGIGPTMLPETVQGKIFLALYSAYINVVFVAILGLMLAPVLHRILHVFHVNESAQDSQH